MDPFQTRQAETQKQGADAAVTARLPETYQWALVPEQKDPKAPVVWNALRLSGSDPLAVRVSRKLKSEDLLVGTLGSTILRKHLDEVPLWRGDHVAVRQLVEDFARYLYLPRLSGPEVVVQAMRDGVALLTWRTDTFAYAESFDEANGRYRGLRGGSVVSLSTDDAGLIVKSDVAYAQLEAEVAQPAPGREGAIAPPDPRLPGETEGSETQPPSRLPRRFYGTVRLNPVRAGLEASQIAEEVIAHLAGQIGAEVEVTLEIQAELPGGASEQLVRTVTENSRTLKFESHEFEVE